MTRRLHLGIKELPEEEGAVVNIFEMIHVVRLLREEVYGESIGLVGVVGLIVSKSVSSAKILLSDIYQYAILPCVLIRNPYDLEEITQLGMSEDFLDVFDV